MTRRTVSRSGGAVALAAVLAAGIVLLVIPALASASAPPAPTVTIVGPGNISQTPPPTAAAPVVDDSYVQLYLDDDGMGADSVRFSNDGGDTWGYTAGFADYLTWNLDYDSGGLWLDGPHTVTAQFSGDGGTTWGPTASATTLVDQQAPVCTAPQGYWNNHYAYRLSAHDQIGLSGVQRLWYRVDVGQLTEVTTTASLGTSAPLKTSFDLAGATGTAHSIDYIAQDFAGNYAGYRLLKGAKAAPRGTNLISLATSAYVVIDRTAPVVRAWGADSVWHHGIVIVRFSARDRGGSGVDEIQYSITRAGAKEPGVWTRGDSAAVTRAGKSRVWFRAIDSAQPKGNVSSARSVVVKVD